MLSRASLLLILAGIAALPAGGSSLAAAPVFQQQQPSQQPQQPQQQQPQKEHPREQPRERPRPDDHPRAEPPKQKAPANPPARSTGEPELRRRKP